MTKSYKLFLIAAITFLPIKIIAQGLCPYIGPDLSLPCGQNSTTLTADFSNCPGGGPGPSATTSYTVANIPFAPSPVGGTVVNTWTQGNSDDGCTGALNIGFSFCFYGNTYTQFYLSTNGWISFTNPTITQATAWTSANTPLPSVNANVPRNAILGPFADWYPGSGGIVRYQTIGVAPCRKLVVSWSNIFMFSCGNSGNFQIVLYESTNIIENHITLKNNCGWNGNAATQAIHNATGTVAVVVPGRNASAWNTTNNAYRWSPAGATVAAVPTWYQVGNPVAIGTGLTITVTPPAGGAQYTCHNEYPACYAGYSTCMGYVGASGPDTIQVIPGPPNITPTIPGPYDFCPATSITVAADQMYAQYLWSDGSTGPTYTTNIPGPISVDVVDVNGCTGTATAVLNQWPNPVLNVVPVDPAICPGSSIQMTASGALTYVWSPANSLDNPNNNVVNANPTATTIYSVVGTDVNGCIDSTFNTVTVLTPPTVVASANDPGVCPTLGTTVNAVGALNYVWSPAATVSTPNAASSNVFPVGTTNYQVVGTDANGCSDTDNVTVLVYDLPNVSFTAPVIDGCSPVVVDFQSNANIASGTIVNYIWNIEGMPGSNQQNPSYTFITPGAFDVQLVAVSDMGCIDSASIVDYINVYSIPIAGFFATPNPADLNAVIDFTNTSSLDAVNFLYDFGGLATSNQPSPTYQFGVADTFNVILYVSTIHGCTDTTSQQIIINDVSEIWVPCGFTPGNQDGLNDTWFPVGRNLNTGSVTIEVEVYDRWGMNVYQGTTSDKPWTGKQGNTLKDCPQDVYVYKVYFKNEKGEDATYTGHVTLIR